MAEREYLNPFLSIIRGNFESIVVRVFSPTFLAWGENIRGTDVAYV
jgi:hypothetical protein